MDFEKGIHHEEHEEHEGNKENLRALRALRGEDCFHINCLSLTFGRG